MFDFEKLEVYSLTKEFSLEITRLTTRIQIDRFKKDQLSRASFSILLNIAEGAGRFTNNDKRRFYVIARGSAFECVAILDFLKDLRMIEEAFYQLMYKKLESISKMLYRLIRACD